MTMTLQRVAHPGVEERLQTGEDARILVPPGSHEGWVRAADRPDPVALLEEQDATRDADLVPVRHGRMLVSAFTFYRGAAKIMAEDLYRSPTAGLEVQLCGDAHLSNFGVFGSPERTLVFDINDFDETLPGPFEYDVKRLAASINIAGRHNGFSKRDARAATKASVTAYRDAMAGFAQMRTLDIWYAHLSEKRLMKSVQTAIDAVATTSAGAKSSKQAKEAKTLKQAEKRTKELARKARTRDSLQALSKLGELVDGQYRIVSQPPVLVPIRDFAALYDFPLDDVEEIIHEQLRAYRRTLQPDRRRLLERFELVDVARKVVGVGSVGTRAFIVLLQGRDQQDPLFLQLKEATSSVLEAHLPRSRYRQPGQRVVQGQRLMQATSDIFLGWTAGVDVTRSYYWRQLRDMKGSADVESMIPMGLTFYAQACGWTLARAHARSGDPVAIASYLGPGEEFDDAITDFAVRYTRQNEQDYKEFAAAVKSGRLEAVEGT